MNFDQVFKQIFSNEAHSPLLPSGMRSLDNLIGGGFTNEVTVIAGRPNHGKTLFLFNLMLNLSYYQEHKGMVVMPMNQLSSFTRQVCSIIQDQKEYTDDWADDLILDSLSDVKSLIRHRVKVDFRIPTLEEVFTTALAWKATYLILDDFFLSIEHPKDFQSSLKKLYLFSKEHQIPVFLSLITQSRVEKRGGDRRPEIGDLYRSEIVCQYVHKIFQTYSPFVYGIVEDEYGNMTKGTMEICLQKNNLGRTGTLTVKLKDSGKIEADWG